MRHRKFLKQLEMQKNQEREEQMDANNAAMAKKDKFKNQAAKQRDKIRGLKGVEPEQDYPEQLQEPVHGEDERLEELMSQKKAQALTADNLA